MANFSHASVSSSWAWLVWALAGMAVYIFEAGVVEQPRNVSQRNALMPMVVVFIPFPPVCPRLLFGGAGHPIPLCLSHARDTWRGIEVPNRPHTLRFLGQGR